MEGGGGGGVVDLDGVLGALAGAMGFSLPGAGCGLRWTCSVPGSLPRGLDLIGAIQTHLTPPPPHPSVPHAFPLHRDYWIAGAWLVIWADSTSPPSPLRPVPGTCFGAPPAPGGSQAG